MRDIDADILFVQELLSSGRSWDSGPYTKREAAERSLRRLADATGFRCDLDGEPMLGIGRGRRHVGLLYRDGIDPIPGQLLRCNTDHYAIQNGLVAATFDIDGAKLRAGSAHMPVRDPGVSGWHEAGVVMYAFDNAIPGICGGDWQSIGLDPVYDPNPYDKVPWDRAFSYQLDEDGLPTRKIALRLEKLGGFRDCARLAGARWHETTGHHPTDPHRIAPRRIDRLYATHHFPDDAVVGFEVTSLDVLGNASDHRPVSVIIDEDKLRV